jgi:hypothetical protein
MLFVAPEEKADAIARELGAIDLGCITTGERGVILNW